MISAIAWARRGVPAPVPLTSDPIDEEDAAGKYGTSTFRRHLLSRHLQATPLSRARRSPVPPQTSAG